MRPDRFARRDVVEAVEGFLEEATEDLLEEATEGAGEL